MTVVGLVKQIWQPPRTAMRPPLALQEPPVLCFLLLLLFELSYYTQLGVRIEILGALRHELLLGSLLIVMSAVSLVGSRPALAQERGLLVAMALFVVVHLIQIPFAANVEIAKHSFLQYTFRNIIFYFFIIAIVRSPRQLIVLTAGFVFAMFWIYQEAVRGLISGSLVWRNQGILRLHGSVPRYGHANGLSLAACMGLPFIFYLLPVLRRYWAIVAFLVATIVLAALCIVNTGSRAGYVGMLALIPYWIVDGPGRFKRLLVAIVIGAAVFPLIPEQYIGRFESIGGEEVEGRSREARMQILADAWEVFKIYPYGVGLDGFQVVRMQMFGRFQDTHNLYAQVATHLGIQGLIVFAIFVYTMFVSLNRSLRNLRSVQGRLALMRARGSLPDRRALAAYAREIELVLAVVRATKMLLYFMLVNGIFAHTLYHDIWWFMAGITTSAGGIALAMARRAQRGEESETHPLESLSSA